MTSTSSKNPKIALVAASIYIGIMGSAMFYMKTFQDISYGDPRMVDSLWPVLIVLNAVCVFFVTRYFSWQEIGFRRLNLRQLGWFLPPVSALIAMSVIYLSAFASASLDAAQWRLLGVIGFTTLLVGFGEEMMFRGIVLHGFLKTKGVLWAMLVSAVGFSSLHAVNIFGGTSLFQTFFQLVLTFLFGFLFAPLMIKLNNILPLIIFHWLWDFMTISAPMVGADNIGMVLFFMLPMEIIVGGILWLRIHGEQDRERNKDLQSSLR